MLLYAYAELYQYIHNYREFINFMFVCKGWWTYYLDGLLYAFSEQLIKLINVHKGHAHHHYTDQLIGAM